jgi:hypothetical protein
MIPASLLAKKGDKILPKIKELLKWIDSQRLISIDSRVLIHTTPNGSLVSMTNKPPSIVTPLQVRRIGEKYYCVGEGYINGKLPKIKPATATLQDIVDPDGIGAPPANLPETRPILVCAKIIFDSEYRLKSSEIVTEIPSKIPRSGSADYASADKTITGLIPLAYLRSNNFIQFVTHNIQVRAFLHNGSYRVIYWPT